MASSVAIRMQLIDALGIEWARDPEHLRHLAIGCLDDQAWADVEDAQTRTPSARPGAS